MTIVPQPGHEAGRRHTPSGYCQGREGESITVREAASNYVANGGESRFLQPLLDHYGHKPLAEITQEVIDLNAATVCPGVVPSTLVRQYYVPLAAILHHAASLGLCERRKIKRPGILTEPRLRWIWPAESVRLAAECGPHFRPTYLFLQHTGALLSEVVFLDWQKLDLEQGVVQFPATKSADERNVSLPPEVTTTLESLAHRRGSVFRRPDGEPYKRTGKAAAGVKTAFAAACRRARIENYTLRDTRTTWSMWHFAVNRDLDLLMLQGGWRDERCLLRYKTVPTADLDTLRAALRKQRWDSYLAKPWMECT